MTRVLWWCGALLASSAYAADTSGLDLTIEVLGREDRIDERIVNRIEIPGVSADPSAPPLTAVGEAVTGVGGVVEGVVDGVVAPLLPILRYDQWVEQRREVGRERESR